MAKMKKKKMKNYVTKENAVVALAGAVVGLGAGLTIGTKVQKKKDLSQCLACLVEEEYFIDDCDETEEASEEAAEA